MSFARCQRLSVRISIGSHAPKFQSKIVNRSQDESVHWFPPSRPRKFLIVNAQLRKGMSVNQSPNKSAMMSMNRAKCATMYPRKFVTTFQPLWQSTWMTSSVPMLVPGNVLLQPDKSVLMLWSRFQDKPMRLNVRLNTLKSVVSLALDTITKFVH